MTSHRRLPLAARATLGILALVASGTLASCTSGSSSLPPPRKPSSGQTAYWTLFASASNPQIQAAALPLSASSTVTSVPGSNAIQFSAAMAFDSSARLWITSFPSGGGITAAVYSLPITSGSTPALTFNLPSGGDIDHMTFDAAGNLWMSDFSLKKVYEFNPPFTASGTLTPAVTVSVASFTHPSGLALDAAGNLYVTDFGSSGLNSIAVFTAPVTSASTPAFYLNGLSNPGGLIFDAQGNLYASTNGPAQSSIVRYNAGNLVSGATPDVVDTTGLGTQNYEADFAFDSTGNLYVADCGNASVAGIRSYPTGSSSFTSSLAPSATYTNANVNGCVWGIAIH